MGSPRNSALKEAPVTAETEWLNPSHPCRGVNRVLDAETGRVELLDPSGSTHRKKFALIGFSSATRGLAPLADPEWVVVGMNQLQRHLRHAVPDDDGKPIKGPDGNIATTLRHGDLWFEIHKEWNTAVVPGTDHAQWLAECEIPCYMTDVVDGIPTSMRYPIERHIEKFDIDYFTSTVAYMCAWAIDHIDQLVEERAKEFSPSCVAAAQERIRSLYSEYTVGIFGIDLIVGEEYTDQRPCAEFWLGQMLARDISVVIPEKSALLKQHYRYGYDIETPGLVRHSDFLRRRQALANDQREAAEKVVELWARCHELREAPWTKDERQTRLTELEQKHRAAAEKAIGLQGALTELDYWKGFRELRERGGALEG